jgi:hypothetical protein
MRYSLIVLLAVLVCAGFGCSYQHVRYKLDDIPSSSTTALKNFTLGVEPLFDLREKTAEDSAVFEDRNRDTTIDGKHLCINAEKHYENGSVTNEISSVLVEHLKKKNLFKDVVLGTSTPFDYKLTGSVTRFYGQQEVSTSARIGSQFGLIGALMTSNAKTNGTIRVELTDIKITDKNGNVAKKLDTIREYYEGEMPADGYCWQIYWNTNERLKAAIEKLALALEKDGLQNK